MNPSSLKYDMLAQPCTEIQSEMTELFTMIMRQDVNALPGVDSSQTNCPPYDMWMLWGRWIRLQGVEHLVAELLPPFWKFSERHLDLPLRQLLRPAYYHSEETWVAL